MASINLTHKQLCEKAVRKAERVAKAISMGEEIKADTDLTGKLAEKLPTGVYRTRWYDYLHDSYPNAKLWTVFCNWLKREEGIAHTNIEQQLLASDLLGSKGQSKPGEAANYPIIQKSERARLT